MLFNRMYLDRKKNKKEDVSPAGRKNLRLKNHDNCEY